MLKSQAISTNVAKEKKVLQISQNFAGDGMTLTELVEGFNQISLPRPQIRRQRTVCVTTPF